MLTFIDFILINIFCSLILQYSQQKIMDTNDKLIRVLRSTLKSLLNTINNEIPYWHYGIMLNDSSTSSLASVLGLSNNKLVNILKASGLLKNNKAGTIILQTSLTVKSENYSWGGLLNDAQLQQNYFQKMKVNKINDLDNAPKKQMWWLGIGHDKNYKSTEYNPSTQFRGFTNGAPKLDDSVKEIIAAGSTRMIEIAELIESNSHLEDLSSNVKDVTSHKNNQDDTKRYHISDSCMQTIMNLSISISECKSKLEVEKQVTELISVVLNNEFEQQAERAKSLQEYESYSFTPLHPTDNDQGRKLPLLSSLHLPLTPYTISTLLNEILILSEKHPKTNLLTLKRFDGSSTTFVPIPEAKNVESFDRNIRRKKLLQKHKLVLVMNC